MRLVSGLLPSSTSTVLSKRASKIGDSDSFYFDTGIPQMCYNTIFDEVVEPFGDWEEYDIVIRKLNQQPWYKAYSGAHDFNRLSDVAKTLVVEGPLTEEERSWERYDLDQLYGTTSYSKIKAKLGEFIRKVDVDFKKNFSEELDALVEKEKEQWKSEGKNEWGYKSEPKKSEVMSAKDWEAGSEEHVVDDEDLVPKYTEAAPAEAPKEPVDPPRRSAKRAEIDWVGLADGTYNGKKYLGVPKMTDEEKDFVIGIREDGSFIYKSVMPDGKETALWADDTSSFLSPSFFHVDPLSGNEW